MINIASNTTQSLYFTLTETLGTSSSDYVTLVLLPKQGTVSQSIQLGVDISTNKMRWNTYLFTGSINAGTYDYRVYSGSMLCESGYATVDSGSSPITPTYSKQPQRIVFR
jgi:hypothetical protein